VKSGDSLQEIIAKILIANQKSQEKENQMKCNVGKTDRIIRLILGAGIIVGGVYFQSWWGAIGVVPILTAAIGWCPAYLPFGISTCKK
jgi:hypothetical protein